MKFGKLKALAHNLVGSVASGIGLLVVSLLTSCASLPPSESEKLVYDTSLTPRQVYELFADQCGIAPKDSFWANAAGNGFGQEMRFDMATNSAKITHYHLSFGSRSEPDSFWGREFGQTVLITQTDSGSHIELRGQMAAHSMRSAYKAIGEILKQKPRCGA